MTATTPLVGGGDAVVATYGPGGHFAAACLIDDATRYEATATVAEEETDVAFVDAETFRDAFARSDATWGFLDARARQIAAAAEYRPPAVPLTPSPRKDDGAVDGRDPGAGAGASRTPLIVRIHADGSTVAGQLRAPYVVPGGDDDDDDDGDDETRRRRREASHQKHAVASDDELTTESDSDDEKTRLASGEETPREKRVGLAEDVNGDVVFQPRKEKRMKKRPPLGPTPRGEERLARILDAFEARIPHTGPRTTASAW